MSRFRERGAGKASALALALLAGGGLFGIATLVSKEPKAAPGPLKPQYETKTTPIEAPVKPTATTQPVVSVRDEPRVVKAVKMTGGKPTLTTKVTVPEGGDPYAVALAATLKGLDYGGIRVLATTSERTELIVDMSPSVLSQGFGTEEESEFLRALSLTLGQFTEVKTFRLRVDGQIVDTLGHIELTEPIDVVRKGSASP